MSTKIDGVIERLGALSYYQVWQQVVAGFASVIGALHFLMIVFHFVDVRHRSVYYTTSTCTYSHNTGSV